MSIDLKAALFAFLFLAFLFFLHRLYPPSKLPRIRFSNLSIFYGALPERRVRLYPIRRWLERAAFLLLLVSFTAPALLFKETKREEESLGAPTKGIQVAFLLDASGSMGGEVPTLTGGKASKLQLVKQLTYDLIEGSPELKLTGLQHDQIGLIAFARGVSVRAPMTMDREAVIDALKEVSLYSGVEEDGSSIGYAIYTTAEMITSSRHFAERLIQKGEKPPFTIEGAAIILMTDGFQNPNPLDQENIRSMDPLTAAKFCAKEGIKLFIMNVDPRSSSEEFLPFLHEMQKTALTTGGKFYSVSNTSALDDLYADLSEIEQTILPPSPKKKVVVAVKRVELLPWSLGAVLIFLVLSLLLKNWGLRSVP